MTEETKKGGKVKRWRWGANRERIGPLYNLLQEIFPTCLTTDGYLSYRELSQMLGYTHQALRRRVETNSVTPALAQKLISASEGRLTPERLWPFILRKNDS